MVMGRREKQTIAHHKYVEMSCQNPLTYVLTVGGGMVVKDLIWVCLC